MYIGLRGKGSDYFPWSPALYQFINKHSPLFPRSELGFALKGGLKAEAQRGTWRQQDGGSREIIPRQGEEET